MFPRMKSVAVLGASSDRSKFGNKAVRAFIQRGYRVFPINLKEATIEGIPAFRQLSELPERPDLISVYLPPAVLLNVLPEFTARGCDELWLNPGTDTPEVIAAVENLGLKAIQACSLVRLGFSPAAL